MDEFPTEFPEFRKIGRLSRNIIVTEKIDGTNALVAITTDGRIRAGSRTRWLDGSSEGDNFGFQKWVEDNKEELITGLGPGLHYGEWWGRGIQRSYGKQERMFSLFNTKRWGDAKVRPACCGVVPILYEGAFETSIVDRIIQQLRTEGSVVSPGFMNPEGVVVFHEATNMLFKKTLHKDEEPKGLQKNA